MKSGDDEALEDFRRERREAFNEARESAALEAIEREMRAARDPLPCRKFVARQNEWNARYYCAACCWHEEDHGPNPA